MKFIQSSSTFFCTLTSLWLLIISTLALGNNHSTTKRKVINHQISSLKTHIRDDKRQLQQAEKSLKQTEITIAAHTHKMAIIDTNIGQQNTKINQLMQQQATLLTQRQTQQLILAKQLRTNYIMMMQQSPLRMLIKGKNLNQSSRLSTYYNYYNKDRLKIITDLNQNLIQLNQNKQSIQQNIATSLTLKTQQHQQQQALLNNKHQRINLVQIIHDNIQTKTDKLSQLLQQKQQLDRVVKTLKSYQTLNKNHLFEKQKHRLSWPTKGVITQHYNSKIGHSQLQLHGVIIHAREGQPVHSIASGKVIFAQWMSGYGLLIIVDQGNGYMTLYGRNQKLNKSVGDWVKTNDIIANVGETGGYKTAGLYFSIRHNSQPTNPSHWCSNLG